MKEVRANGFGGRVAAEPNGPIRGLRKEYTIINEESDGYTLFNTTDERGASKRRGIVAALAAVAMLVPLAFAPSLPPRKATTPVASRASTTLWASPPVWRPKPIAVSIARNGRIRCLPTSTRSLRKTR